MRQSFYVFLISFLFISIGCSSTEKASDIRPGLENVRPADAVTDDSNYHNSLADYLHRVPGIHVTGSQNNRTVTVRGISSFTSNIQPLYVIDGQPVGSNYGEVNRMINVKDINYVRVLKDADASIYGVRGGNGVILIVTNQ